MLRSLNRIDARSILYQTGLAKKFMIKGPDAIEKFTDTGRTADSGIPGLP